MIRVTVPFATGDADCSSLVKRILVALGVIDADTYMWTGNERSILGVHGFAERNRWRPERGDVLWREGHTEVYLGDGECGGARIDERGGVTGPEPGDQTGGEVAAGAYDASRWESAWRDAEGREFHGIPLAECIAQLMEHAIAHAAHGYSQPNRDGDGGTEWVTLTWDGAAPAIEVDGWLGAASVTAWQRQLGTTADGVVSGQSRALRGHFPALVAVEYGTGGSRMVREVQRRTGAPVDGYLGPVTVKALQMWLARAGYFVGEVDGILGPQTAKAVQRSINDGAWS